MLFITYIFILLFFIIVSYTLYKILKLWFHFRAKGQESKHYPIILGIRYLSIPLISKTFSIPSYLIKVFNQYSSLNLPAPTDDWKSIVFYSLYVFAVITLIYIYYKQQPKKEEHFRGDEGLQKIDYPNDKEVVLSPHLHERIQELFELKHKKLTLSYDVKEKVLVGQYSDAFNSHRYFIYCNSNLNKVAKSKQNEIVTHLQTLSETFLPNDTTYHEPEYYFFIENGTFEEHNNQHLKCYTEDGFLNVIIDFSDYLKKNIERFNTNPIDIGEVSLKESFIEPSFNKGKTNLKLYFDEWLEENSLRHISLLADYGMGKTSFLKYYTKYLSQKILEGESFSRYPVFVSLTNTSPMSNDGIETKIESFVAKELGVNYALFERLVHLGKVVFILDGFDEMGFIGTAKTRFDQFNSIWQLATKNNKILISGRPSYLPTDFERKNVLNIVDSSVTDVQLTPFTAVIELDYFELEQIEQTVNIYYQGQEVEQYMNYIQRNHSILDLCKRPSMLHMTMSILPTLYSEDAHKVITSSDIMNKYTEYWISRQESKAITGYFSKNDNRKKEFIMNFFTELSGEMFKGGTLIVSKKVLDELIVKEVQKAKLDIESDEMMFDGFKKELYTGYFIELDINKDAHFKFVHKSIFEFFVSKKIIKLIEEKEFKDKLMSIHWSPEIIDFIDDSIEHEKYEKSEYPSLIMIRDSWLDRWLLIPITYIGQFYFSLLTSLLLGLFILISTIELILFSPILLILLLFTSMLIGLLVHRFFFRLSKSRFYFIFKAYSINKLKPMHLYQKQYFLDFSYYRVFRNSQVINEKFNNLKIKSMQFTESKLNKVTFKSSKIQHLRFLVCNLNNLNFSKSKIYALHFHKCEIKNVNFEKAIFKSNKYFQPLFPNRYIAFNNMTLDSFDNVSLKSLQNFIRNNNISRKNINTDSIELKNKLFAKLEEKE